MTQAALPLLPDALADSAPPDSAGETLSSLAPGQSARIVELAIEAETAGWLRAVGIVEKEEVTVLRRAAFGGPIHVRTSSGGEFALNRALAASIRTGRTTREREPSP